MAYLYRLAGAFLLALLLVAPGASWATIPTYKQYTSSGFTGTCAYVSSSKAALSGNPPYHAGNYGSYSQTSQCAYDVIASNGSVIFYGQSIVWSPQVNACPANSTLSGGSCTCAAGWNEDATHTSCVDPTVCAAGAPTDATFSRGWVPLGEVPMKSIADSFCHDFTAPYVNPPPAPKCITTFNGSISAADGPVVNGQREWFTVGTMTQTATSCSTSNGPATATPAPPCVGQSGLVNGVQVCIAAESAASKEERARSVAEQAGRAAASAAATAGKTPAEQAAASQAASTASYTTTINGGSSRSASAAGAAAGAAAAGGSAAPAAAAAGAGAAAGTAAEDAATAAGKTTAEVAAAKAAATAAAEAAALAGKSEAAQKAAGSAAGSAAANGVDAAGAATAGGNAAGAAQGSGSGSGSGSGGDGIKGYCIEHPGASICKEGADSTFSGVCASPPVCTGDAVLCAVAAATWKQECSWHPEPSDQSALFDSAKDLTGNQTVDLPGNRTEPISTSSFDQSELLGSPAGMSNLSITVMGSVISLPFSSINIWLERLGVILRAVTFLLCMRIVTRG